MWVVGCDLGVICESAGLQDNTENDHRLFYVSVDNLKAGHFSESNMMQMRIGYGQVWLMTHTVPRPRGCSDE